MQSLKFFQIPIFVSLMVLTGMISLGLFLPQVSRATVEENRQSEKDSENSGAVSTGTQTAKGNVKAVKVDSRKKNRKKSKAEQAGGKETEGTKAVNKFEGDSVLKSRYQQNGVALEVDTD